MRQYLFNTEKIKYVKGEKPKVECILCAIRDRDPDVQSLEVFRSKLCMVTVNLYPFNPGHVMIFPQRHLIDLADLSDDEAVEMHRLTALTVRVLREEFGPDGFNIGYNLGSGSGASIDHIHLHVVPRYNNEVGFLDVLGGARVMVIDPREVMERLIARFRDT
jgi:ATP adenylyltransferase